MFDYTNVHGDPAHWDRDIAPTPRRAMTLSGSWATYVCTASDDIDGDYAGLSFDMVM